MADIDTVWIRENPKQTQFFFFPAVMGVAWMGDETLVPLKALHPDERNHLGFPYLDDGACIKP